MAWAHGQWCCLSSAAPGTCLPPDSGWRAPAHRRCRRTARWASPRWCRQARTRRWRGWRWGPIESISIKSFRNTTKIIWAYLAVSWCVGAGGHLGLRAGRHGGPGQQQARDGGSEHHSCLGFSSGVWKYKLRLLLFTMNARPLLSITTIVNYHNLNCLYITGFPSPTLCSMLRWRRWLCPISKPVVLRLCEVSTRATSF